MTIISITCIGQLLTIGSVCSCTLRYGTYTSHPLVGFLLQLLYLFRGERNTSVALLLRERNTENPPHTHTQLLFPKHTLHFETKMEKNHLIIHFVCLFVVKAVLAILVINIKMLY